jgi:hypothetical protein
MDGPGHDGVTPALPRFDDHVPRTAKVQALSDPQDMVLPIALPGHPDLAFKDLDLIDTLPETHRAAGAQRLTATVRGLRIHHQSPSCQATMIALNTCEIQ